MLKNLSKIIALTFATAVILPLGNVSACISDVGKPGPATNCISVAEEGHSYSHSYGSSSGYTKSGSEIEDGVCDAEHNCSETEGTNTEGTDCIDTQGNVGEDTDCSYGTDISTDDEDEKG